MIVDAVAGHLPSGFRYIRAFRAPLATTQVCSVSCHLRVALVPGMAHKQGEGLGVFNAGGTIPAQACLGIYVGQVRETQDEDSAYTFEVNGFVVDATAEGNWTRFLNSSSSQAKANLIALDNSEAAHGKLLPHEVCFVTQRAVLPGEQLCFYYGPEYSFAEEGISARALDAAAARTLPREQQEPGAAHGGLSLWVLERTSARSCRY